MANLQHVVCTDGPLYQDEPHPFATAMADFLIESGRRANRLTLMQAMMAGTNAKYEENRRIMGALVSDSEFALWSQLCSPLSACA